MAFKYDITEERLVQVYLGDMGKLTYNEQLHWSQYNVIPKGKMSRHRFERDFLCKISLPEVEEAPIMYLKDEIKNIQNKFIQLYGDVLFKELNKGDLHFYKSLHIPLTEEGKELDEQILNISKFTTDSFNQKILSKITGKKAKDLNSVGKEIKGTLGLSLEFDSWRVIL